MAIIRGGFLSAFLSVLETELALSAFAIGDHGDGTCLAFLGHCNRGEKRLTRRQRSIIVGLLLEHAMGNKSNAASRAASMIFVCRLAAAAKAGLRRTNPRPLGELVREQGVVQLVARDSDLAAPVVQQLWAELVRPCGPRIRSHCRAATCDVALDRESGR